MYTDGELSTRKSRQIREHLHACWQCRVELQRIGQAIGEFMECREAEVGQSPPLRGWSQFNRLLSSAVAEPEESRRSWNPFARLPHMRFAAAAAVVVAIVLGLYLRPITTVSANSLLDRAQNAEVQTERGMRAPVVYRRIAFRRKTSSSSLSQSGEIETWRDLDRALYRQRGTTSMWPELEHVLQGNHMGRGHVLSATAFREWRDALPRRQESVQSRRLADGSEALCLTVATEARRPDSISQASLVVRAGDWRLVQQNLRVQGESDIQEYELKEISYQVIPRSSVDASIFATSAPPQSLIPAPIPVPPPAMVSRTEPEGSPVETEIQALYALHKVNACLNDNIQVTRDAAGRVIVRGVVDTPQRKERIATVLEPLHGVDVQVRTITEPQSGPAFAPPASAAELAGKGSVAESHSAPIMDALKGKLSTGQIAELSYRAVSLSEDWAMEAWALRRLAEAIPPEDLAGLTKSSQAKLAEMIRDHTASLGAKIAQCRAEFEPYMPGGALDSEPKTGENDWHGSARRLFAAATRAADLTRLMCAGSGPLPVPASDEIKNLVTSLSDAQSDAVHLNTDIAGLLESRAQSAQSKGVKNR